MISNIVKGHNLIQSQIHQALKSKRLPHALLFSGPSGVGKKKMAWALAQSLLCEKKILTKDSNNLALPLQDHKEENYIPCNNCFSCSSILKNQSEHVLCISYETLQIRLSDVQQIPSFLSLQSFAKAKIVLIDSAEKLNPQASNFLLKIIEEPPPQSFFFLISSNPSQISLTIRSRVQNIRFSSLSEKILKELSPQDTESWMIQGARGRLDMLENLKQQKELRSIAFDLFFEIFKNKSFFELNFKEKIQNRSKALEILRFWQELLRDIRLLKLNCREYIIHGDKIKKMEGLSHFSTELLDLWIKKMIEMEWELNSNFDLILCFENFMILVKQSLKSNLNKLR